MTTLDAVVLDLDGTLLDHDAAALAGLATLLDALDVPDAPEAWVAEWCRLEDRHYPAWRDGLISFPEQRRLRLRDFLPLVDRPAPDDAELDQVFDRYLEGYERGWVAFPDALPAVQRLRREGLRIAVLTNGDHEQQTAKLRAIGLLDLCGPVIASSRTGAPKPDPRAYAAACAAVGASPEAVLMVGDNHDLDVLAPRAAGLRAVHLDRHCTHPAPEQERITTLGDLRV